MLEQTNVNLHTYSAQKCVQVLFLREIIGNLDEGVE